MKKPLVFDNDCISSFSWINRLDILEILFPNEILVPEAVNIELSKMIHSKKYSYVYSNIEHLIINGLIIVKDIPVTSKMAQEYLSLIDMSNPKRIGRGEAASIVLAKNLGGTLASNNLRDILPHIKNGAPPFICTDEILYLYHKKGLMSIDDGKKIWAQMKQCGRKLPSYDFDMVVHRFDNNISR